MPFLLKYNFFVILYINDGDFMTKELLIKIRDLIEQKKRQIEEENRNIDRIKELEETPDVQEYMRRRNIGKFRGVKLQMNDGVYFSAYDKCKPVGIYPTVGMYVLVHEGKYLQGFRIRKFKQYKNVESFEESIISEKNIRSFEKEFVVLEGINAVDAHIEFVKLAVETNPDEAVRVMSKKYRKESK